MNSRHHSGWRRWISRDRKKALEELKSNGKISKLTFSPVIGDLLNKKLLEERKDGYYPINDCIVELEIMIL